MTYDYDDFYDEPEYANFLDWLEDNIKDGFIGLRNWRLAKKERDGKVEQRYCSYFEHRLTTLVNVYHRYVVHNQDHSARYEAFWETQPGLDTAIHGELEPEGGQS